MKLNTPSGARRWRSFGPGTIVAVVAAIALGVSGRLAQKSSPDPNAGSIVYEADSTGKLQRVAKPSRQKSLTLPQKPEVALLLDHALQLRLDARQKKELRGLNDAWLAEKEPLGVEIQQAMDAANGRIVKVQADHSASLSEITASLKDYSQLSKRMGERRMHYWTQALTKLTAEQLKTLNRAVWASGKGNML